MQKMLGSRKLYINMTRTEYKKQRRRTLATVNCQKQKRWSECFHESNMLSLLAQNSDFTRCLGQVGGTLNCQADLTGKVPVILMPKAVCMNAGRTPIIRTTRAG